MSASRIGAMILAAAFAGALLPTAAGADEPTGGESRITVSRTDRGLSLEARDASLRDVLQRLAAVEKLELEIHGTGDPRVSATIREASLAETLQRLGRYDFVLGVGRLIVYLGDRSQPSRSADTIERSPQPRGGVRPLPRWPPSPAPEPEPETDADQAEDE